MANTAPMVATSRAKAAIAHRMKMSEDLLKSNSSAGDGLAYRDCQLSVTDKTR